MADASLLFQWRNDPLTRQMSRETDVIPWDTHLVWLARSLADPSRILYVGEVDGGGIGTIRLDCTGDETEISITMAPQARRSYLVMSFLRRTLPEGRVIGWIKRENRGAQRLATLSGFHRERDGSLQLWVRPAPPAPPHSGT